jgi:hypothetical protein
MVKNATAFHDTAAVPHAVGTGRELAAQMPRLILEARRVAATIIHGLHGRRRRIGREFLAISPVHVR